MDHLSEQYKEFICSLWLKFVGLWKWLQVGKHEIWGKKETYKWFTLFTDFGWWHLQACHLRFDQREARHEAGVADENDFVQFGGIRHEFADYQLCWFWRAVASRRRIAGKIRFEDCLYCVLSLNKQALEHLVVVSCLCQLVFRLFYMNLISLWFSQESGYDAIRFASYRTAAKLRFIQTKSQCKSPKHHW